MDGMDGIPPEVRKMIENLPDGMREDILSQIPKHGGAIAALGMVPPQDAIAVAMSLLANYAAFAGRGDFVNELAHAAGMIVIGADSLPIGPDGTEIVSAILEAFAIGLASSTDPDADDSTVTPETVLADASTAFDFDKPGAMEGWETIREHMRKHRREMDAPDFERDVLASLADLPTYDGPEIGG